MSTAVHSVVRDSPEDQARKRKEKCQMYIY